MYITQGGSWRCGAVFTRIFVIRGDIYLRASSATTAIPARSGRGSCQTPKDLNQDVSKYEQNWNIFLQRKFVIHCLHCHEQSSCSWNMPICYKDFLKRVSGWSVIACKKSQLLMRLDFSCKLVNKLSIVLSKKSLNQNSSIRSSQNKSCTDTLQRIPNISIRIFDSN